MDVARDKLRRAVTFVLERKDTEYQDLMAGRLCEMETAVFVSYLMLRDSLIDKSREALAERYVLDVIPTVGLHHEVVTSGDTSLIDRQREILAM